ncbi:MAG: MvaI/BcnI family restriction endonuclease [Chloroflexi bacterium]|nr:MvaI/BcnI family restriction endonuclease [Chloroflexota bacterium]
MITYSKESLINELVKICHMGWIPNARPGNAGGIGNTLEDLLGIKENNLPIPNAAEWELKCQRTNTSSLTTLFHMEPSPRACRFVPQILLPQYGWKHKQAGIVYPASELSFRQTLDGHSRTDRGFMVIVDRIARKVIVSFDYKSVGTNQQEWLDSVRQRVGVGELSPQPYWGFDDLYHKAGTKLLNAFYVQAESKKDDNQEYFSYCRIQILRKFSFDHFLNAIENGSVLVDFNARTGHNHGTKYRLRQDCLPELYDEILDVY